MEEKQCKSITVIVVGKISVFILMKLAERNLFKMTDVIVQFVV